MKTNATLTLLALASAGLAQTLPLGIPKRPPHTGGKLPIQGHPDLYYGLGKAAEARGDLAAAEILYRESIDLDSNGSPFAHLPVAELYDRMGRDREAYVEYRTVVVGYPDGRGASSEQYDPVVLARYGDLALRFGTPDEAHRAYAVAARNSGCDDVWVPATAPRDDSLPALRAAAHNAAAYARYGWSTMEGELKTAIQADPGYWVPHYFLAQILPWKRRDEAMREGRLAASLAPTAKYRAMVERLRTRRRLIDPPSAASPAKSVGA